MKNKTLQPYLWILISGFAFSWMATLAPLAGKACGWQMVAIARCAIPMILVAGWARWDGASLLVWKNPILWMRSLAGSCSLIGTFYCFSLLPLTDIYTISNIFPIWVALLSWPILGRFPSGVVWLSIVSSIVGVGLIQGAELQSGNLSALIVVAVSIFTAIAMMGLNRLKNLDPRAVVVHFSATGFVFAIACLFLFEGNPTTEDFGWTHLLQLLAIGLAAAVGQYFLTKAFTAGDPAKMSVATLSQFVFVMVLDVLVLGNPLDANKLWGIPLVLGPTVWLMTQRVKTSTLVPESTLVTATPTDVKWTVHLDASAPTETNGQVI